MNKKKTIILLILIVFVGALLRFYNIGKESFWLDEGATALAMNYYGSLDTFKNFYIFGQMLPEFYTKNPDLPHGNQDLPVYYFLLAVWVKLFGLNEATLRAFSALFGSLSIVIVFFIAKEIFNDKIALLSSLISSLNLTLIAFSQEARTYSFYLFISLLSVYFLIRFINTKKNIFLVSFVITTIIGVYTHYIFAYLVFFEVVFIYWHELINIVKLGRFKLTKLGLSFFIVLLSYAPLLNRAINQKLSTLNYLGKPTIQSFFQEIMSFNTWIYTSEQFRRIKQNILSKNFLAFGFNDSALIISIILLSIILIIFSIKSFIILLKQKRKNDVFLLLWVILPLAASFITSYLHPRISTFGGFGAIGFIIYVLPAYFILASHGILSLKWRRAKIIILLLVVFSLIPIISYHTNVKKMQFREAAMFLKGKIQSNDVIFFNIRTGITPFTYYYGESNNAYPLANISRTIELSKGKKSIWLVSTLTKYSDPNGLIQAYFDDNYKLAEKKEFFDLTLFHYVK